MFIHSIPAIRERQYSFGCSYGFLTYSLRAGVHLPPIRRSHRFALSGGGML